MEVAGQPVVGLEPTVGLSNAQIIETFPIVGGEQQGSVDEGKRFQQDKAIIG